MLVGNLVVNRFMNGKFSKIRLDFANDPRRPSPSSKPSSINDAYEPSFPISPEHIVGCKAHEKVFFFIA